MWLWLSGSCVKDLCKWSAQLGTVHTYMSPCWAARHADLKDTTYPTNPRSALEDVLRSSCVDSTARVETLDDYKEAIDDAATVDMKQTRYSVENMQKIAAYRGEKTWATLCTG